MANDSQNRPPLDVDHMLRQVAQIIEHSAANCQAQGPVRGHTITDEQYKRLMGPCRGPNDDPTRNDLA